MPSYCILPACHVARQRGRAKENGVFIQGINIYPRINKDWHKNLLQFCYKYREKRVIWNGAKKSQVGICEAHFQESDFYYVNGKKRLIPGVLPSINLPQKSHDRAPSQPRHEIVRHPLPLKPVYKTRKEVAEAFFKFKRREWMLLQNFSIFQFSYSPTGGKYQISLDVKEDLDLSCTARNIEIEWEGPSLKEARLSEIFSYVENIPICRSVSEKCLVVAVRNGFCSACSDMARKEQMKSETIKRATPLRNKAPLSRSSRGRLEATVKEQKKELCLSLFTKSPSTYDELRGVLKLPSKTTLLDFRYAEKPQFGFHPDLRLKMKNLSEQLDDNEKYVFLTVDEMQIKRGLVFDKTTGKLVGFASYGSPHAGESKQLACQVLGVYLKGIMGNLSMMLTYFPTATAKSYHLTSIFWDCLRLLEECGFKVMAICCDASPNNRKFFTNLTTDSGFDHKFVNPFDETRHVFLWPDPPHLLKTARNSMLNNKLKAPDGEIRWKHIEEIYNSMSAQQLHQPNKLTTAHVNLSSASKMSVKLAAQVLSASVARILSSSNYHATARYAMMFNKFFDICNSSSGSKAKKNTDMAPLRNTDDERLSWLKNDFMQYFKTWKSSTAKKEEFISMPTYDGLKILVQSITELATYLLTKTNVEFLCLARISQDCLERYFGKQRAVGRRCDNPTVLAFSYNDRLIATQRSVKQIRGNVHCLQQKLPFYPSDESLPKRRKKQ